MKVLVTGGAGYIGSHTCLELLLAGYEIIVVDNLCNSREESLKRVQEITGNKLVFHRIDLLDVEGLEAIFKRSSIDAVIHFAGLKAVGESVAMPLHYYHNNVTGSLNLFSMMQKYKVKKLVFSSSATVYGDPQTVPITEDFPVSPINPYGRSKLMVEEICRDLCVADASWSIAVLRYFNPVGAHQSGRIGEDPNDIPNNLFPYISQVAVGRRPELSVFGNDYSTDDGTGVRDYIHVLDLAMGHLKALDVLDGHPGAHTYNLGTGRGHSVLEIVKAFEQASGKKVGYQISPRRSGDIATCYADPSKASRELNWAAKIELKQMCEDAWRWQLNNPKGYL